MIMYIRLEEEKRHKPETFNIRYVTTRDIIINLLDLLAYYYKICDYQEYFD